MSGGRGAWLSWIWSLQHPSRGREPTATECLWLPGCGYTWSPSAYPPGKCENFFTPLYNLSPLSQPHSVLAVLWARSAAPVFNFFVLTAFSGGSPSPLPMASTGSAAFPSSAEPGAVAQTIWFLTASQLSAARCRVAVKLTASVVSLHPACRMLLLEVVILELSYRLQKYQLYSCMPFQIIPLEKLGFFFFLITVSDFSFTDLNIVAYLLCLHFKGFCLFVCNYPQVF